MKVCLRQLVKFGSISRILLIAVFSAAGVRVVVWERAPKIPEQDTFVLKIQRAANMEIISETILNPQSQALGHPTTLETWTMLCAGRCLHSENKGISAESFKVTRLRRKQSPLPTLRKTYSIECQTTMARMRKSLRGYLLCLKISPGACASNQPK